MVHMLWKCCLDECTSLRIENFLEVHLWSNTNINQLWKALILNRKSLLHQSDFHWDDGETVKLSVLSASSIIYICLLGKGFKPVISCISWSLGVWSSFSWGRGGVVGWLVSSNIMMWKRHTVFVYQLRVGILSKRSDYVWENLILKPKSNLCWLLGVGTIALSGWGKELTNMKINYMYIWILLEEV